MSGMRARYPGFEYENYEDFCRRTPDVIPEQVWIPQPPYLEYWEGAEIKAVETNKNVNRDEKKFEDDRQWGETLQTCSSSWQRQQSSKDTTEEGETCQETCEKGEI